MNSGCKTVPVRGKLSTILDWLNERKKNIIGLSYAMLHVEASWGFWVQILAQARFFLINNLLKHTPEKKRVL